MPHHTTPFSHRTRTRAFATAAIATALCVMPTQRAAAQQGTDDFHWQGRMSAGNTLSLRNLNGAIRVERATGDQVVIDGRKHWRTGNPADVRIEASRPESGDGDLMVCALWGDSASCDADGYRRGPRDRRNTGDVSVEFTVRVPEGVRLDVSTVNGELRITGATSDVVANTVNGSINASSLGGPVKAATVNGDIEVSMGRTGGEELAYSTVNGSIKLAVPAGLNAEVNLATVNGRITSDLPVAMQGRISRRHVTGKIGNGGQHLSAKTVNGSITIAGNDP